MSDDFNDLAALRAAGSTPEEVIATEPWPPNMALAKAALAEWGGEVVECPADEVPGDPAFFGR